MQVGSKFRPSWIIKNHLVKYYGFPEDVIGTVTEMNDVTATVQFVHEGLTANIAVYLDELNESGAIV
jgi:hypothetical protein